MYKYGRGPRPDSIPRISGRDGKPGKTFEKLEAADASFRISEFGDRI